MGRDMGKVIDTYNTPPEELIPELLLFGELVQEEVITDRGLAVMVDIMRYNGQKYIMKKREITRWCDEREDQSSSPIGATSPVEWTPSNHPFY